MLAIQPARQLRAVAHLQKECPIGRILAVLTLFLSGTLVGGGSWMLCHPSVAPFLVPGATDIQGVSTGVWEWQIAYAAPGPPYAWYLTLSRTMIEPHILAASGIPLDAKDLRSLHAQGIRAILSLTEHSLLTFRQITPALLADLDMTYVHVPIPDQHPPTLEQAQQILDLITAMTAQQRPLFVHCHAGVGRTGTILHLYYLAQGLSWDETKAKIRVARVQCLLLAEEQLAFLRAYTTTTTS